jgi:dihydrofolate reductase
MIFSRTEEELGWNNSELVLVKDDRDYTEAVGELKKQPGNDMYLVGGATIAQTFVRLGLVDEYRLLSAGRLKVRDHANETSVVRRK